MSETTTDSTVTPEFKYTYDQTKEWANTESPVREDGITFLYVFGAFAFLILFAALILFFVSPSTPDQPDTVIEIEDIGSETDATTTEVHSEFDLVSDVQKGKNVTKETK